MITVKTTTYLSEISVAMSYLEDNDIKCYLKDELFVQIHPAAANSQGVQLQVAEEDVEKAIELLISGGFATKEEYEAYENSLTRFVNRVLAKLSKNE